MGTFFKRGGKFVFSRFLSHFHRPSGNDLKSLYDCLFHYNADVPRKLLTQIIIINLNSVDLERVESQITTKVKDRKFEIVIAIN